MAMDESYATIKRFAVEMEVKPRTLRGQMLAACPIKPVQCDNCTEKSLDHVRPSIHRSTGHASVVDPLEGGCNYRDRVAVRVDLGTETKVLKAAKLPVGRRTA